MTDIKPEDLPNKITPLEGERWRELKLYFKENGETFEFSDKILISSKARAFSLKTNRFFGVRKYISNATRNRIPINENYDKRVERSAHWRFSAMEYLSDGTKKYRILTFARAILCAFDPDGCHVGYQPDHIDHDIDNNDLDNLQWLSAYENLMKKKPRS